MIASQACTLSMLHVLAAVGLLEVGCKAAVAGSYLPQEAAWASHAHHNRVVLSPSASIAVQDRAEDRVTGNHDLMRSEPVLAAVRDERVTEARTRVVRHGSSLPREEHSSYQKGAATGDGKGGGVRRGPAWIALACIVIAALVLCMSSWVAGVDMLGLDSRIKKVAFLMNVVLFLTWAMLTHWTRDKEYSVPCFLLVVTGMKILGSLILWRFMDGSFVELAIVALQHWQQLCLFSGPALLYAFSDLVRIDAIQETDPLTYEVLANLRLLLLAVVWVQVMNRYLGVVQWSGLAAICLGCIVKEGGRLWLTSGTLSLSGSTQGSTRWSGYLELLFLNVLGALAAVWNEKLLKHKDGIPLNLQNAALYVMGFATYVVFMLMPRHALLADSAVVPFFDLAQWNAVLGDRLVFLQAVLMALAGVSVGYVLKVLSSVHREVAAGVIMFLEVPLIQLAFGYPIGWPEVCGVGIVLIGIAAISAYPVPTGEIQADAAKARSREVGM